MSARGPAFFDLDMVDAALAGTQFAGRLYHLSSTGSTSALAIEAAQHGAATGVWIADEQTAGRGRSGHTWHSPAGDGLYMSALFRPRLFGVDALKLSLAAGLAAKAAVIQTVDLVAEQVDLRWPNDLMVSAAEHSQGGLSRKFGGVLTESAMDGGDGALAYAVIGIGMNLNHRSFPDKLRDIATSLRLASGETVSRERLLTALLRELESEIALVESEGLGTRTPHREPVTLRFERGSTWVRGVRVHVAEDDGYTGVTEGLDPHGLLRVRIGDGSMRVVRHGGVRRAT